jgi:acetyl esterase/lipase/lysophospholipase L1-like esterase
MRQFIFIFFSLSMLFAVANAQQEVIRLYSEKAPGSENWTWQEESNSSNMFGTEIVYNISEPTITVFPAQGMINTGTAVIIAPGGGLFSLSINSEGNDVAKWLSNKGITAFVLKYRLVHTKEPVKEFMSAMGSGRIDSIIRPISSLSMQDGLKAVEYVRSNAAFYAVNPNRIGFMGFSAGGGLTMSVAYNASAENRPDFIAPIYAWDRNIIGHDVPKSNMPAFIVAASDDQLGLVPKSIDIYEKWNSAKQMAELLVYQNGGHGFGMKKNGKLTDTWINRFEEWLANNQLLWPENPTGMLKGLTYDFFKEYKRKEEEQLKLDWANRNKYKEANTALNELTKIENRIVFMGNSITEGWKMDSIFFKNKSYVNRGISGQTTSQMLLRFRDDVIDLNPKVVVILGGINDIAENTGPISLKGILGNITSMVELAKENGIKVILCSVLPANVLSWRKSIKPADKVIELNSMIKAYANKNNLYYVDYYTQLVDEKKGLKEEYTEDGVHPTIAGYHVMEPIIEKAIQNALNNR